MIKRNGKYSKKVSIGSAFQWKPIAMEIIKIVSSSAGKENEQKSNKRNFPFLWFSLSHTNNPMFRQFVCCFDLSKLVWVEIKGENNSLWKCNSDTWRIAVGWAMFLMLINRIRLINSIWSECVKVSAINGKSENGMKKDK